VYPKIGTDADEVTSSTPESLKWSLAVTRSLLAPQFPHPLRRHRCCCSCSIWRNASMTV